MRQKSCAGALILYFFVSRRARSRSRADECSGRGYQLPLLFDLPDGEKEMGLGATIGDPEAGVPLHEEPKRIKSIPVWDVRAIEKSWMLLTRRL